MNSSSDSCWKLVSDVVSYCCDIREREKRAGVRCATTPSVLCIWYFVSRQVYCNMQFANRCDMEGMLRDREAYRTIEYIICTTNCTRYRQVRRECMLRV